MKITTQSRAQEKYDIKPRTFALAPTMSTYPSTIHDRLQQEVSVFSERERERKRQVGRRRGERERVCRGGRNVARLVENICQNSPTFIVQKKARCAQNMDALRSKEVQDRVQNTTRGSKRVTKA